MRNIKQLSLGNYVYHGCEHSRFGHTLGAMHLAGLAFDSIRRNSIKLGEKFDANDFDRRSVRMAALLHDVGHAPFSHSLEGILGDKHEKYSITLVKNYFEPIITQSGLDIEIIINLILGDPYPEKSYLSRIVSGQLDVDRFDYLLRDSYYAGVSYGNFDLNRIIDQLCMVDNKFVVLQGGYEAVEQMIFARYQMYQQVYFHKTKRSFELMLWKCGELLKNSGKLAFPSLAELKTTEGQNQYVQCDDRWFLNQILKEDIPDAVKSIAKMIIQRKPYLETYSPLTYRKESSHVITRPEERAEGLDLLQTQVLKKLPELGIEPHEFLTDNLARSPYSLMPNYNISNEADAEGDTIQIYYKNRNLIEPIEKRSNIIHTLAVNQPFMIRGFVIPEKYESIRIFLSENFDYPLPEHS